MTLQLAKDIISDLREILKQVRSTENKLRNEQEELENTIERALGKMINIQYSTFKHCHIPNHWNSRQTWNFCFLLNFQLKKIRSKIIQVTLLNYSTLIAQRCPKKQNSVGAYFSWKLKENKYFTFDENFNTSNMTWTSRHQREKLLVSNFGHY